MHPVVQLTLIAIRPTAVAIIAVLREYRPTAVNVIYFSIVKEMGPVFAESTP